MFFQEDFRDRKKLLIVKPFISLHTHLIKSSKEINSLTDEKSFSIKRNRYFQNNPFLLFV